MKTVRCINDEFTEESFSSEKSKAILKVGEELPKKGKVYIVLSEYYKGDEIGYKLEGLDYDAYGIDLYFTAKRFETVENKFTPNSIGEDGQLIEVRNYRIQTEIKF